jgi:GMP synthase-like glutamine amidotransferase
MRILAIVHVDDTGPGVFADVARERGHELVYWPIAQDRHPPGAPESFDAVWVFGGGMHPDQDEDHPWLAVEEVALRRVLERGVPTLGVCLGGQLMARALDAPVERAPEPEIGWLPVTLLPAAADDPLFHDLPERFLACQWHSYRFRVPEGATLLAESAIAPQAYRVGRSAWGMQFHAEVSRESLAYWIAHYDSDPDAVAAGFDQERMRAELEENIDRWNELGRTLAARFLDVAAG